MWYISTVENYPFKFSTWISQGEVLLKALLFFYFFKNERRIDMKMIRAG